MQELEEAVDAMTQQVPHPESPTNAHALCARAASPAGMHACLHSPWPQVQELEKQKQVLVRNISCLYTTAVEENKRKDALIRELRMEQFQAAAARAKGLQT